MAFNVFDAAAMLRAIELARLGEGHVEPNPMVGAVIASGGTGAEIIALCRDAALHAIGEMDVGIITKPQIHMKHLLMSIKDMKPRTTPEMLRFYESFRGRH